VDPDAVELSRESAERNIQSVRPGMLILAASAKTGEGTPELLGPLESRLAETRAVPR
jgi:Ni2+-binding GTPase involved in maturation of urease and hydrogenase